MPVQHRHHDEENRYEVRPLKGQAIGKVRLLDPGTSNRFFDENIIDKTYDKWSNKLIINMLLSPRS